MTERITIGLMSGTSLDGTDAVAMAFDGRVMRSLGHSSLAFPPNLRAALAALTLPGPDEIERMGEASVALARHYAEATGLLLARTGLSPADVAALGVHGQTIRHRPQKGFTLQLNHPALVAELTGIDVVADLRSRDVAAGGEGAPLVPAFHAECFTGDVPRVVLNIGGIANISVLPARSESPTILGGDTGPGNMLIDTWTQRITGALYDRDGRWAASGRVSTTLLDDLLSEPYFALPIPKSTGRELFSPAWLDARLCGHESLP
ncbi:MAG: anhydro-N-acetylmuramic acid kinase, partial [Sutterella wadsworthensis]